MAATPFLRSVALKFGEPGFPTVPQGSVGKKERAGVLGLVGTLASAASGVTDTMLFGDGPGVQLLATRGVVDTMLFGDSSSGSRFRRSDQRHFVGDVILEDDTVFTLTMD